jgi:hypothetical protein
VAESGTAKLRRMLRLMCKGEHRFRCEADRRCSSIGGFYLRLLAGKIPGLTAKAWHCRSTRCTCLLLSAKRPAAGGPDPVRKLLMVSFSTRWRSGAEREVQVGRPETWIRRRGRD